jgi:hypothetical protein
MTRSGISLVIAALLLQGSAARAAQLDKDSCAKLKTEQAQLEQGGARGSMGKGPEWAKVNLAPDKLEQIRRLIELDEQLLFRCGGRPLVIIPHDPDPAAREVENKEGAAKGPPAKATKAPDAEKKQAVPLKKAAAPPPNQPAKGAAKETPPVKTAPQPEAASAPAKEGEDKKAAVPPVGQPAKEAAKEIPPAKTTPQPDAASAPAKEGEDKKSSALQADQPPVKEAAKETPSAKAAPQPQAGPASTPAPSKEAEDKKAAAAKAAKAKAKKRANDAYSPPFSDWNINPFAAQAGPPGKK